MKKIYILLAAFILSMILLGCKHEKPAEYKQTKGGRFSIVEIDLYYWILADKETGVMYAVSTGTSNAGHFTLLVDPDGKPLIWEDGD